MTNGLEPYPAMKDSGVPWLGEVPSHWEVRQLGRVGRIFKGSGGTREDDRVHGIPCIRYGELYTHHQFFIVGSRARIVPESTDRYTPIRYGDVLFAGSGETIDDIGKSAANLIPSTAYCGGDVIIFRPAIDINARFLGYATDCPSAAYQKACMGRGITVMHIYGSELKHLTVALPPLPEQAAIARYLGRADERIRRCIQTKETLVELLEERRQALINEVVTGRVDVRTGERYAAYKRSGVEWLGEMPAHWGLRRLRNAVTMRVSNVDKHVREGETPVRLCNYLDVYNHDYINQRIDFMQATATSEEIEQFRLEEGDVLITKDSEAWDDIGVPAVVTEPAEDLISGYHLAILRPFADVMIGGYLLWALHSRQLAHQFHVEAKGVTRYGLSHSSINSVWVSVPPLPEQAAIASYLDIADQRIQTCIQSAQRQIDLLKRYRTRLVADVVTGKLDVREAAAEFAGDLDEPESITGPNASAVMSDGSAQSANVVTKGSEA